MDTKLNISFINGLPTYDELDFPVDLNYFSTKIRDSSRAIITAEMQKNMIINSIDYRKLDLIKDAITIEDAISVDSFEMELEEEKDGLFTLYGSNTMHHKASVDISNLLKNCDSSDFNLPDITMALIEFINVFIRYPLWHDKTFVAENTPECICIEVIKNAGEVRPNYTEEIKYYPGKSIEESAIHRILDATTKTERYIFLSDEHAKMKAPFESAGWMILNEEKDINRLIRNLVKKAYMENSIFLIDLD